MQPFTQPSCTLPSDQTIKRKLNDKNINYCLAWSRIASFNAFDEIWTLIFFQITSFFPHRTCIVRIVHSIIFLLIQCCLCIRSKIMADSEWWRKKNVRLQWTFNGKINDLILALFSLFSLIYGTNSICIWYGITILKICETPLTKKCFSIYVEKCVC